MSSAFTGRDAWTVLGRLALIALRGQLCIESIKHTVSSNPTYYHKNCTVDITMRYATGAPVGAALTQGTLDDQAQAAEASSIAWAEVSQDLAAQVGQYPPDKPACQDEVDCPTCGVGRWLACVPVHEGEKPSSTWAHPSRRAWHRQHCSPNEREWRPHPRAAVSVEHLRNFMQGHNLNEAVYRHMTVLCDHADALARRDALGIQETAAERGTRLHREIELDLRRAADAGLGIPLSPWVGPGTSK